MSKFSIILNVYCRKIKIKYINLRFFTIPFFSEFVRFRYVIIKLEQVIICKDKYIVWFLFIICLLIMWIPLFNVPHIYLLLYKFQTVSTKHTIFDWFFITFAFKKSMFCTLIYKFLVFKTILSIIFSNICICINKICERCKQLLLYLVNNYLHFCHFG